MTKRKYKKKDVKVKTTKTQDKVEILLDFSIPELGINIKAKNPKQAAQIAHQLTSSK